MKAKSHIKKLWFSFSDSRLLPASSFSFSIIPQLKPKFLSIRNWLLFSESAMFSPPCTYMCFSFCLERSPFPLPTSDFFHLASLNDSWRLSSDLASFAELFLMYLQAGLDTEWTGSWANWYTPSSIHYHTVLPLLIFTCFFSPDSRFSKSRNWVFNLYIRRTQCSPKHGKGSINIKSINKWNFKWSHLICTFVDEKQRSIELKELVQGHTNIKS